MGVYVKGMDMPKAFYRCPFASVGSSIATTYCRATKETCGGVGNDGCPLVEVKAPHGRLIDADAIDTSYSDPEVIETLNSAPTVLEAEE